MATSTYRIEDLITEARTYTELPSEVALTGRFKLLHCYGPNHAKATCEANQNEHLLERCLMALHLGRGAPWQPPLDSTFYVKCHTEVQDMNCERRTGLDQQHWKGQCITIGVIHTTYEIRVPMPKRRYSSRIYYYY